MKVIITLLGIIAIASLGIFIILLPYHFGLWCRYNTELLATHYLEREVKLANWPFVVGCYVTQIGIVYGLATEIWCQCMDLK